MKTDGPAREKSNEGPEKPDYLAPSEILKAIRAEAQQTMAGMASLLNLKSSSSYAYYENPEGFGGITLPASMIHAIFDAQQSGRLKISSERLVELLGTSRSYVREKVVDPRQVANITVLSAVPDLKGDSLLEELVTPAGGEYLSIPTIRQLTDADPEELVFIELGDPNIFPPSRPKDKLLVDMSVRSIRNDGLFLLIARQRLFVVEVTFNRETGSFGWVLLSNHPEANRSGAFKPGSIMPCYGQILYRSSFLVNQRVNSRSGFVLPPEG